ncbi:MAG: DNA polymerase III subunit epsilon [Burkholderiales bacterium]|nr:MAG: DNA polymerase III subunit epsilon [Burkholderiales bacterium]
MLERIRVIDLETAGNAPTDVCEIGWQDVVRSIAGVWEIDAARGAAFVNPGRPISPETMAVHHIIDADVVDAPFWKSMAPSILRPEGGVVALAAHRAAFEQRFCTPRLTGAPPWICTWKCALRLWPNLTSFSNQMLRYQRMPEGLDRDMGLPAHRALPDAYVTAHHLRDMLRQTTVEQLVAWSLEPGVLPRVPSGPDRGKPFDSLTVQVLQNLARDRDIDVRFTATRELDRRDGRALDPDSDPSQRTLF